jgi:hypothetical protein
MLHSATLLCLARIEFRLATVTGRVACFPGDPGEVGCLEKIFTRRKKSQNFFGVLLKRLGNPQ